MGYAVRQHDRGLMLHSDGPSRLSVAATNPELYPESYLTNHITFLGSGGGVRR